MLVRAFPTATMEKVQFLKMGKADLKMYNSQGAILIFGKWGNPNLVYYPLDNVNKLPVAIYIHIPY